MALVFLSGMFCGNRVTDLYLGSAGLEKLDIDVTMLATRLSTVLNMEHSSVETTNPFEG